MDDDSIVDCHEEALSYSNNGRHFMTKHEESQLLMKLQEILNAVKTKKKKFSDVSRLICCGCCSLMTVLFLAVFYVFDVIKYNSSCKKSSKYVELCEAPSIGFWTRFVIILLGGLVLFLSMYCTGITVIIFNPQENSISINKKKLFCLPSSHEYPLSDLIKARLEIAEDSEGPKIATFSFYSVNLVFKNEVVNLGLGRDCFGLDKKKKLIYEINEYLEVIRNE